MGAEQLFDAMVGWCLGALLVGLVLAILSLVVATVVFVVRAVRGWQ